MKIKWNWGTKLTLFIILFMLLILSFVYRSFQRDVNLVEKDYYPKGLQYQQRIDEMKNARMFQHQVNVKQKAGKLIVYLPSIHPDTGNILFFRPSDKKEDIQRVMPHDSLYQMQFDGKNFKKGHYVLKVYWEESGNKFYVEKGFYFRK